MKASRVRDFVIYIGIALALVGLGMWYVDDGGRGLPERAWRWVGLAIGTPILFGYAVQGYRRDWGRVRFWGIILALLA